MSRTRKLLSLPKTFKISLRTDGDGYIGRECPQEACKRYFKVAPGTGLTDVTTCRCPYCGHEAPSKAFFTRAQIEYAHSVVKNQVVGAFLDDMRSMKVGGGISMRVRGQAPPVRGYSERDLETETVCHACTLRFAIYGVFGFCPDCGAHNNLGILDANLRMVAKMLSLAATVEADIGKSLVENALEDCVSAFDGWGRAVCAVFAAKAVNPDKVSKISFQNAKRAHEALKVQFGFDAEAVLGVDTISALHGAFQKRHLLAHRMGVVDADYLLQTNDATSQEGRRIRVGGPEVEKMAAGVRAWTEALNAHLASLS